MRWVSLAFVFLAGCQAIDPRGVAPDAPLVDDRRVYAEDNLEVLTVRVKVRDLAALERVNADAPDAEVEAVFTEGDFAKNENDINAMLGIRGATSRLSPQKSYRIKLDKGLKWRGHRVIHLNKHPFDFTRVRNKLAFDLFKEVDDFTSLRTQFVRLFINDKDYGLFTQIEDQKEDFLETHGLDEHGCVFKARNFEFFPLEDRLLADPYALDEALEVKTECNIEALLAMIDSVNDLTQPIDDVIAKRFNRANYITWLAINVLTGNFDTTTQNFFLYARENESRFYFLPWDYDGAFGYDEQYGERPRARWRAGVANWWPALLHHRFLEEADNRVELDARIAELRAAAFSDAKIQSRLTAYRSIVEQQALIAPDLAPLVEAVGAETEVQGKALVLEEYARVAGQVAAKVAEYRATLSRPMPVFLHEVELTPELTISCEPSFDFLGRRLSYDFEVSRAPTFDRNQIVKSVLGRQVPNAQIGALPQGRYFWRVIVRAEGDPEAWQIGVDDYFDPQLDDTFDGVRLLEIPNAQ